MRKLTICAACLLTLSGCLTPYEQAQIAERDRVCSEDWGLTKGTPEYGQCKALVAYRQATEEANSIAAYSALMPYTRYQPPQPAAQQWNGVTCYDLGGGVVQCR